MSFGGDTSKTSGANAVGMQLGPTKSSLDLRHSTESWRPSRHGPAFVLERRREWGLWGPDAAGGDVFCVLRNGLSQAFWFGQKHRKAMKNNSVVQFDPPTKEQLLQRNLIQCR